METIKTIALAALVLVAVFAMANYAETQRAKLECRKLQDQARVYKSQGFYITADEKLQCDHYEMDIDAPVGVRPLFINN